MTTNTDKIRISGTPSKFDANELLSRQQQYHNAYKQTSLSCTTVRGGYPKLFLQAIIDHAATGHELTDYPASLEPTAYSIQMRKPANLQEADLARIDSEVKEKYVLELQAEHDHYKELLTQQLLQKEQQKKEKAESEAQSKLLAKVKAEVDACFSSLVIPE